jgi:Tol biopolymer transport system component
LYTDALDKQPASWSPDGRMLLYETHGNSETDVDIWLLRIDQTGSALPRAVPLLQTPLQEGQAHFSVDGRWIVYGSTSAAGAGIYVMPFTRDAKPPSAIRQIPAEFGAGRPRWRPDGKEILFLSRYGEMMVAEVRTSGATIRIGDPRRLFAPALSGGNGHLYDVSRDGERFLLAVSPGESGAGPVTVIQNWRAGLAKRER